MFLIEKDKVALTEDKKGLTCEASEVGLPPGDWPQIVGVIDESGSGFMFMRGVAIIAPGGDIGGYDYYSRTGPFKLTIFND